MLRRPCYHTPGYQVVRPANQLQLSEAEMKEEHTRVLTANDPNGESTPVPCATFKTKLSDFTTAYNSYIPQALNMTHPCIYLLRCHNEARYAVFTARLPLLNLGLCNMLGVLFWSTYLTS